MKEGRIFDNDESDDDEDLEQEMQDAFELLNQRERDDAEERLNAYYDNLNDSEDLQKEQEMLNGGAHMIGGKKKSDESNFSSYITQMEKELKLQTV